LVERTSKKCVWRRFINVWFVAKSRVFGEQFIADFQGPVASGRFQFLRSTSSWTWYDRAGHGMVALTWCGMWSWTCYGRAGHGMVELDVGW
jgi:hypothetical protein